MTDERTPEQRQADNDLNAAIEAVVRAYGSLQPSSVITGWAVLGTGLGADGAGDLHPDFVLLPDNGRGMSHVQLIGLLRAATKANATYSQVASKPPAVFHHSTRRRRDATREGQRRHDVDEVDL